MPRSYDVVMTGWPAALWRLPAPTPPALPVVRDVALVGAAVAAAVVEGALRPELPAAAAHVVATALAAVPLIWRRRHPLLVLLAAVAVGLLASVITGQQTQLVSAAFLLLYPFSLVRWGSGRAIVAGLALVLLLQVPLVVLGATTPTDAVGGLVVVVALAAVASALRIRAAGRVRELEMAAVRERERLARDLHDTVAHHVSAIAVRANAGLATSAADPARATEALEIIVAEASRTLEELRGVLRLLRDETPGAADLGRVHQLAAAPSDGLQVRVAVDAGEEPVDERVADAVFRIAQESVTNARRHSRGASRVDVTVEVHPSEVRLRVVDDGGPAVYGGDGFGLRGMRERAALVGGRLAAGSANSGGWTVEAVLPRTGRT